MSQPSSKEEDPPSEVTPLIVTTGVTESSTTRLDPEDAETGREASTRTESRPFENDFDHFVDTMAEDELDKPWPATFERSISLLAGPIRDAHFIEEITKSPKITPNIRDRRRVRLLMAMLCIYVHCIRCMYVCMYLVFTHRFLCCSWSYLTTLFPVFTFLHVRHVHSSHEISSN